MCWRETMPSWGTLTGLRPGPMQTLVGSTRPHAMSCTGVRPSPSVSTGWLCVCVMKSSASPCSVHWQLRKPTISWAAPKAVRSAGQGRGFYTSALLCSVWWDPHHQLCGPQHKTDLFDLLDLLKQVQRRVMKMMRGSEHLSYEERLLHLETRSSEEIL